LSLHTRHLRGQDGSKEGRRCINSPEPEDESFLIRKSVKEALWNIHTLQEEVDNAVSLIIKYNDILEVRRKRTRVRDTPCESGAFYTRWVLGSLLTTPSPQSSLFLRNPATAAEPKRLQQPGNSGPQSGLFYSHQSRPAQPSAGPSSCLWFRTTTIPRFKPVAGEPATPFQQLLLPASIPRQWTLEHCHQGKNTCRRSQAGKSKYQCHLRICKPATPILSPATLLRNES
jgi:hypothetical protein